MGRHAAASSRLLRLLALVSVAAVLSAFIGWRQAHQSLLDSAYHALKTVSMGSVYDKLDEQRATNAWLELGRWLGVFVEFSTLAFLFTSIFSEQVALLRARLFFRGHVIVVGETDFADRFGEMEGNAVIHLRNIVDPIEQVGTLIRLPFTGHVDQSFKTASAHHARAVLVATSDDARTISLAMAAQRRHARQEEPPQVLVRLHDYWLAQRLHNLPGAELLQAVSEPALAARDAMRRHPAFLTVEDQHADRSHALLVGEPDWMEAMMAEILLSAGTLRHARPVFTFACAHSTAFRARLIDRYPEIGEEAELHFLELGGINPWELTGFTLAGVSGPAITAVYFLFPHDANTISAYLAFLQRARTEPEFTAPIFVLADSAEFDTPVSGAALEPLQAVPFGAHRQIIAACGLLAGKTELAEQAYHSAYLAFADPSGKATKSWTQLNEDYRSSNRRAVAHILAKLFDAGFDVRSWMANHDVWSQLPALHDGERLFRDQAERERLAALEHQRWISDRRLNGWRYGETRDDVRKLHPDIRPFDQLRPETREYSYQFVDLLDAILARSPDGLRRHAAPKTSMAKRAVTA